MPPDVQLGLPFCPSRRANYASVSYGKGSFLLDLENGTIVRLLACLSTLWNDFSPGYPRRSSIPTDTTGSARFFPLFLQHSPYQASRGTDSPCKLDHPIPLSRRHW